MKHLPRQSAFTAVELIVVVAILAMLGALVLPRVGAGGANYRVDAAARRIAADLNYARGQARLTSTAHSVTFDTSSSRYAFQSLPSPDRSSTTYAIELGLPPYEVVLKVANFNGSPTLNFSAFGVPDNGGEVQLECGAASRTVAVNATTGEASVP